MDINLWALTTAKVASILKIFLAFSGFIIIALWFVNFVKEGVNEKNKMVLIVMMLTGVLMILFAFYLPDSNLLYLDMASKLVDPTLFGEERTTAIQDIATKLREIDMGR